MANGYPNRMEFRGTLASGTASAVVNLGNNSWRRVMVFMPSLSTNAATTLSCSNDGVTYAQLYEQVQTATVQFQQIVIASTAANCWIPLANVGVGYLKFVTTDTVANGATYKVVCEN